MRKKIIVWKDNEKNGNVFKNSYFMRLYKNYDLAGIDNTGTLVKKSDIVIEDPKKYVVGVNIGNSRVSCALFDLKMLCIVEGTRTICEFNNKASLNVLLECWSNVILVTVLGIDKNEISGIGIGMPQHLNLTTCNEVFNVEGKVSNLTGRNVEEGLKMRLGHFFSLPIRIFRYDLVFGVGEAWNGISKNDEKSIVLNINNEFGTAFIKNGYPVFTGDGVPSDGNLGLLGYANERVADYFSVNWFFKRYKSLIGKNINNLQTIVKRAEANRGLADLFDEYGSSLGKFIARWIKDFGANVLIVGGEITRAYHLFGPELELAISNLGALARVELSKSNEDADIIGCARLFYNECRNSN